MIAGLTIPRSEILRSVSLSLPAPWCASLGGGRLLIQPEHVASGIAEPGGDLGCIGANRLNNLSTVCQNLLHRGFHAIHHDVDQQPRLRRWRTSGHPSTAHLPNAVV